MLDLYKLILEIGGILVAGRVIGVILHKIHQPQVIANMVTGIMLGPSLLGWLAPRVSSFLFPSASLTYLAGLSQLGLVLFMFLVGLALNPDDLRGYAHNAVLVSHVSIIAPFVMGAALALVLYPQLSDASVRFMSFALFMGVAMSITAFPVLAHILAECNLLRTRMGSLSIACAAVDDVSGWCILACIVPLVRVTHYSTLWLTLAGSLGFVLIMVFGVKRLLKRLEVHYVDRGGLLTENALAIIIIFVLASALVTESLGIHVLLGAFLAGCVMPKHRALSYELLQKFETVTAVLLLPVFFALTGLRTNITLVKGAKMWTYCGMIIVVSIGGKLGGSMTAARASGMPWRDSAALGILMNTRGLMELVILNIGLDFGVISTALFSMMVLMALITTLMTKPLLDWVYPIQYWSCLHQISPSQHSGIEKEPWYRHVLGYSRNKR